MHIAISNSSLYAMFMIDPLHNFPGYLLRRASAASLSELSTLLAALDIRPTEAKS